MPCWASPRSRDRSVTVGEFLDGLHSACNFRGDILGRRELRRTQPIMSHHALFVRIRDSARFERVHVAESALYRRLNRSEEAFVEVHAADIECEVERIHAAKVLVVTLPKFRCVHQVGLPGSGGGSEFRTADIATGQSRTL